MLLCGHAYHLYFHTLRGASKYKYCVLVSRGVSVTFLLISSQRTELEKKQSAYLDAQVVIDAARHDFLDHDSYIDCTDPIGMMEREANDNLENDSASRHFGQIARDVITQMVEAIERSRLLRPLDKRRFLECLDQAL